MSAWAREVLDLIRDQPVDRALEILQFSGATPPSWSQIASRRPSPTRRTTTRCPPTSSSSRPATPTRARPSSAGARGPWPGHPHPQADLPHHRHREPVLRRAARRDPPPRGRQGRWPGRAGRGRDAAASRRRRVARSRGEEATTEAPAAEDVEETTEGAPATGRPSPRPPARSRRTPPRRRSPRPSPRRAPTTRSSRRPRPTPQRKDGRRRRRCRRRDRGAGLMGQKVNPYGFRLGVTTDWKSRWFASRNDYADYVIEGLEDPGLPDDAAPRAAISRIEVERFRPRPAAHRRAPPARASSSAAAARGRPPARRAHQDLGQRPRCSSTSRRSSSPSWARADRPGRRRPARRPRRVPSGHGAPCRTPRRPAPSASGSSARVASAAPR